jgi:hypothetical protein
MRFAMYRIVFGSVVVVSLMAGGSALAIEAPSSADSHGAQAASPNKSAATAKIVRHGHKSGSHRKVAQARGVNAKPRATEPFGSAGGVDLPVASPRRESAPSETPWTGFHVGVEGGRSGR